MNQAEFSDLAAGRSQNERVLACLKRTAGQWTQMVVLWRVSGAMAVHSRIADLRKLGYHIEHRNEWVGRSVHSFYRLVQ